MRLRSFTALPRSGGASWRLINNVSTWTLEVNGSATGRSDTTEFVEVGRIEPGHGVFVASLRLSQARPGLPDFVWYAPVAMLPTVELAVTELVHHWSRREVMIREDDPSEED